MSLATRMAGGADTPTTAGIDRHPGLRLMRDAVVLASLPVLLRISLDGADLHFTQGAASFQGHANADGSLLHQLSTLAAFAVALALHSRLRIRMETLVRIAIPFAPFFLLALASVLWSDFPPLTLRRSVRLLIEFYTAIVVGLAYRSEPGRLFAILFAFGAVIMAVNLALIPFPSRSMSAIGFHGIHSHKLEAGRFVLIMTPVFYFAFRGAATGARRLVAGASLAACLLIFPLTQAKTAWVALPACAAAAWLALAVLTQRSRISGVVVGGGLAAVAMGGMLLAFSDITLESIIDRVFGDTTLTGRDQIWRYVFHRVEGREVLGTGFGAMWQVGPEVTERIRRVYRINTVNQAHSGYLDAYAQLGMVGSACLAFTLAAMLAGVLRALRTTPPELVQVPAFALWMLTAMAFINLTDSTFYLSLNSLWALVLVFYALALGLAEAGVARRGVGLAAGAARP